LLLHVYAGAWTRSLLKSNIDGVPLAITSRLLPLRTWFRPLILLHVHWHAKSINKYQVEKGKKKSSAARMPKTNFLALIDHLKSSIHGLSVDDTVKSVWQDYDQRTHYSQSDTKSKADIIQSFVGQVEPATVWDMGANDGFFSRLVSAPNRIVLSLDSDPGAIEKNFIVVTKEKIENVYPLLFDVTNPPPDIGWANTERTRLSERSKPDLILALALIHHLVITFNIPFRSVAEYMSSLCDWLIIEFVPANDDKVAALPDTAGKQLYNRQNFIAGFSIFYDILEEKQIASIERSILLLKKKNDSN
jgi:hypothetical protein